MSEGNGFWRLSHNDLAAVLAKTDLSWETARAYLAVADLTVGYGKERDVVSLSQIAARAGMERTRVPRCLDRLACLGLYVQEVLEAQKVIRWVTWPPPPVTGAGTSTKAGNRTVTGAGTHQEPKTREKAKRANHPDSLLEIVEYAAYLEWPISECQARKIQEYYAPPGGDGIWRDARGRVVKDWHRCVVTFKNSPYRKDEPPPEKPPTEDCPEDDPAYKLIESTWEQQA